MKKLGLRLAALVLLLSIVMVQTGCSRNLLETVRSWVRVGDVECMVSSPRYYASGELSPEAPLNIQVEIRYVGLGEPSEVEVIRGGSYYLPTLYAGEEDTPVISSSLSSIAVQDRAAASAFPSWWCCCSRRAYGSPAAPVFCRCGCSGI